MESDGGGTRGLVTTILLQRITATPGLEDLLKSIDLVDLGKLRGADHQCNQFPGTRYHRLGPIFPAGVTIQMDGVKKDP